MNTSKLKSIQMLDVLISSTDPMVQEALNDLFVKVNAGEQVLGNGPIETLLNRVIVLEDMVSRLDGLIKYLSAPIKTPRTLKTESASINNT